jgi:hypothetical protein
LRLLEEDEDVVGPGRKEEESGWILAALRWDEDVVLKAGGELVERLASGGMGETGGRTGAVEFEVFLQVGVA